MSSRVRIRRRKGRRKKEQRKKGRRGRMGIGRRRRGRRRRGRRRRGRRSSRRGRRRDLGGLRVYGGDIFPKSAAIERNSITSSRRESSSYLYT